MFPAYTLLAISLACALLLWISNDDRGTHP